MFSKLKIHSFLFIGEWVGWIDRVAIFRKMQLYASVGIVPWDNLIVTYDNSDGIIDLRIVKAEIENKLVL